MRTLPVGSTTRWVEALLATMAIPLGWLASMTPGADPASLKAPNAYQQNQRLGRGVNVLGYDPLWTSPDKARFRDRHFTLLKQAGFDHVRINLHPFRHAKLGKDNRLVPAWLERADWAVRQALANHLRVILDFHEFKAMGEDPEGNHDRFLAVWRQLAEHYRDQPADVFFEILNEPNKKLTPELWNTYAREALAVIRRSNPVRTVVIGPGNWNSIRSLEKLELPEGDRGLIVTVHYYSPFPFTHQGAAFANLKDKVGVPWTGSSKEQEAIQRDFDKAQTWAQKHRRPLYLGEFGVFDRAEMSSRVRWTTFVTRQAEQRGWSWAWWQFDNDFVLYDIPHDRWMEPIRDALIPRKR